MTRLKAGFFIFILDEPGLHSAHRMDIYLLRHGIAEDISSSGKDKDRVLTAEGVEKLRRSTPAIKALNVNPSRVISSHYARALQTARIVAEGLGVKELIEETDLLVPEKPPGRILEFLQQRKTPSVLLVGHEPHMSSLISLLLCGSPHLAITMKKGGLCKLSLSSNFEPGTATLEWLLAPKHLVSLS